MQLNIIGKWLIDGRSPNTGLPVLETRRLAKITHEWDGSINLKTHETIVNRVGALPSRHTLYEVGKTYAIQLGRGKPAIGRTPPIARLRRQDVRDMTHEDAIASGFNSVGHYLETWCAMHDPDALSRWNAPRKRGLEATVGDFMRLVEQRPAEHYDAWVIRFADTARVSR